MAVVLNDIWNNKGTDPSGPGGKVNPKDEIYFFLTGNLKNSIDTTRRYLYGVRLPYGTYWSLGQKSGVHEQSLAARYGAFSAWEGSLEDGDTLNLIFDFMEEDNGKANAERIGKYLEVARKEAAGNPEYQVYLKAAEELKRFVGKNDDDFLGTIYLQLTNESGEIKEKWTKGARATNQSRNGRIERIDLFLPPNGYNFFLTWQVNIG